MSLAEDYRRQRAWRRWELAYDALPLRPGDRVLDLGCAIGDQAADLAARGARVTGLDMNPELLDVAIARGIPDAAFEVADLRTWDAPAFAADGLWASFTAAYFPDLGPALARWAAAVRPGGWLMLIEVDDLFAHDPLPPEVAAGFRRFADDAAVAGRYDFRMGRRLPSAMAEAGLTVERAFDLPDQELSADGPAAADVVDAWRARFARMRTLQDFLGEGFPAARDAFLAALAAPDHRARCRVVAVLARKPAGRG